MTCLGYLTGQNYESRKDNVKKSLTSLKPFLDSDEVELIFIDNCEDSNSHLNIKSLIRELYPDKYPIVMSLHNRWYDIAAHYVAYLVAKHKGIDYFIYTYDDFVFYDTSFIQDSIDFMNQHLGTACIRLTEYDISDRWYYDTAITPKTENAESVSHYNAKSGKVHHIGPFKHGDNQFYESNWRPTSRPALWRTSAFESIIGMPETCNVLQQFEKYMYDRSDEQSDWCSGFIDCGVCHTFPQDTSVRISSGIGINKPSPVVDLNTLKDFLWGIKHLLLQHIVVKQNLMTVLNLSIIKSISMLNMLF